MKLKKGITFIFIFILMLNLTACGSKSSAIFTLNGEQLGLKEVDGMGYIYAFEHSLVESERLQDFFENGETYEEHYKKELEQEIILTTLLYKEAEEKGQKLSSEQKQTAREKAEALVQRFGKGRLQTRDLTEVDIEKLYEWKVLGEAYAGLTDDVITDHEDEAGDDSAKNDGNNELEDVSGDSLPEQAASDETENVRYIRVLQVTFSTALLSEDGMVQTEVDGTLKQISSAEMMRMRQAAEDFSEQAKNGEDIDSLLQAAPEGTTSSERTLKYDDLSSEYQNAVRNLSVGGISGVISGDYGYYVVKLLDGDEIEHAKLMEQHEIRKKNQVDRQKLFDDLFGTYVGNNKEYRNDAEWDKIIMDIYLP